VDALYYVLLTIPRRFSDLFSMAALLGTMMSLGVLAGHSELISIRVAGVSIGRILWAVMKAGLLMLLVVTAVSEYVAPETDQLAQKVRTQAITGNTAFQSGYGAWVRDGRRFINIGRILPDGHMQQIKVYQLDPDWRLREFISAGGAAYQEGYWQLKQTTRAEIGADGFQPSQHRQERWESLIDPQLLNVLTLDPASLSVRDLLGYIRYLNNNALDSRHYELAFWKQVFAPLSTLVMLLLATPFVFSAQRSGSAGQRLLIGVLIGVAYYLADQLMSRMGLVYGFYPLLSALLAPLLFALAGLAMLRRV